MSWEGVNESWRQGEMALPWQLLDVFHSGICPHWFINLDSIPRGADLKVLRPLPDSSPARSLQTQQEWCVGERRGARGTWEEDAGVSRYCSEEYNFFGEIMGAFRKNEYINDN